MIGTIVPVVANSAQAAASTAAAVANAVRLFSSMTASSLLNPWATATKDIGGFTFDYIGEQSVEAKSDITDHYTEDNNFYNDHIALKPQRLVCRGFVSDIKQTRLQAVGLIGSLTAVLSPVQPYLTKYAPGTAGKMGSVLNVASSIERQVSSAVSAGAGLVKIIAPGLFPSSCQAAYTKLMGLRGGAWMVVTPFKTFGKSPEPGFAIEDIRLVSPDGHGASFTNPMGWTDVTVTLKEIRLASTIPATGSVTNGNSAGDPGGPATNIA